MKGRFSRIFELFNQRNTEYYQQAFERLEKEDKTTFNFAAAFYPTTWLVFRKMYGWAILFVLASNGISLSLHAFYPNPKATTIIFIILSLVAFIGFGFWGNSLYYKMVKSRVHKGYNSMEGYNSIDPVWGIVVIGIVIPSLVGIGSGILISKNIVSENVSSLISVLTQIFFMAIPCAISYKKFHSQESVEPIEVTEESVNKYLEKADPKHLTVSLSTMIVICSLFTLSLMSVMAVVSIKVISDKIKNQLDKIGEEIDKTPSKKGVLKDLSGHKSLEGSVKLSNHLNREVAKKQNSSKVTEKTVNQTSNHKKKAEIEEKKATN